MQVILHPTYLKDFDDIHKRRISDIKAVDSFY